MYTKQLTLYTLSFLLTIFVVIVLIYFVVNKKTPKISDLTNNLVSTSTDTNTPNIKNSNLNSGNYQNIEEYFNKNDFVNANKSIDAQLSNDPNNIQLLLFKATTLAQQGSLEFKEKELGDQARSYAEKALKLDPKNIQALTLIGYTYEIQQDYVNAHKYYDQALVIDPNNVDTLAQKAHAYDLQGKIDEAGKLYEKTIQLDSNNENVLPGYAKILEESGDNKKAKEIYLKIADTSSNIRTKAEAIYSVGRFTQTEKYSEDAAKLFVKSINTDPTFATAHIGLAYEVLKQELESTDPKEKAVLVQFSLKEIDNAIKINKNLSAAYIQKALILNALSKRDLAIKTLDYVIINIIRNDITLNTNQKINTLATAKALLTTIKK